MNGAPHATAHLSEIPALGAWIPIRRHFDIGAFGVNAWVAREDGERIVGEHDERASGHEELYVVVEGHATFTVGGDVHDAPAGTLVTVHDPELRRGAVARDRGTTILTVGAKPGEAYRQLAWEENAEIYPLFERGEYAEAKARLEQALERHPDGAGLVYNLACAEARLGETDAALEHLSRAVELWEGFREAAQDDPDLESIRDDRRFPGR